MTTQPNDAAPWSLKAVIIDELREDYPGPRLVEALLPIVQAELTAAIERERERIVAKMKATAFCALSLNISHFGDDSIEDVVLAIAEAACLREKQAAEAALAAFAQEVASKHRGQGTSCECGWTFTYSETMMPADQWRQHILSLAGTKE